MILLPPNAARVAEHSLLPGIVVTQLRRWRIELDRMQLNADPVALSACNTIVDDMPGTAAQRQLAAVHRNDTSSARNAYPAFSVPAALPGADTRRSLALFVHRNALRAAGKATKRRPIAVKTTRKRKQSESVSRCGICAR
ncbi:hypothetical protein H8B02_19750 [Bradyrhizobium sp. Pear77]|uniref:hypothetical protein n=1 Tax=Bradyrhizobium altum TaxID=1571202 RepID=UPI001E36CBF3|nr:hypothetical protein [Bradyrhizobium altum]MCC8955584.1 hypothetical protein [Bradyrhizobium altum]